MSSKPYYPSGAYQLYVIGSSVYVIHTHRGLDTSLYYDRGYWHSGIFDKSKATYLGLYETLNDIYDAFPEYFI